MSRASRSVGAGGDVEAELRASTGRERPRTTSRIAIGSGPDVGVVRAVLGDLLPRRPRRSARSVTWSVAVKTVAPSSRACASASSRPSSSLRPFSTTRSASPERARRPSPRAGTRAGRRRWASAPSRRPRRRPGRCTRRRASASSRRWSVWTRTVARAAPGEGRHRQRGQRQRHRPARPTGAPARRLRTVATPARAPAGAFTIMRASTITVSRGARGGGSSTIAVVPGAHLLASIPAPSIRAIEPGTLRHPALRALPARRRGGRHLAHHAPLDARAGATPTWSSRSRCGRCWRASSAGGSTTIITSWDQLGDEWYAPFAIWEGGLGIWGGVALGVAVGAYVMHRRRRERARVHGRRRPRDPDRAGHRPPGQLLQPGALRRADRPPLGARGGPGATGPTTTR